MRWIFFSLLLANVVLYVWHSMESEREARFEKLNASSASPSERAVQGRPLVLVSELTEEEKAEFARRPRGAVEPEAAAPPAPAPVPVPAAAPAEQAVMVAEVPPGAPAVPAPVVPNQCLMFGPVTDKQYDQIVQRLLARSIVPERRLVDVKNGTEYWAVLPPFDDEKAAVMKLQEIQGRGIQGGQIIPKGELANAIAFGGVFAQKGEAEQMADKMRAKGLKVEVRAVPQVQQQKWVSLSERQAPKLSDELWKEIEQDFPRLKKETYFCH
jgi:hypothetical protein